MLNSLEFYFNDLLEHVSKSFELSGKKLAVHAYSCHMLNGLIDLDLDNDDNDAVILITTRSCYRILKGLITYKKNVFYIDIDSANSVIVYKLGKYINRIIEINENVGYGLSDVSKLLNDKIIQAYFNGVSPGIIAIINKVSAREISKVKRKLMDAFLVNTTQELYIKQRLYRKVSIHYRFER